MPTTRIFNYLKVNNRVITGGMPLKGQLRAAAQEGYRAVINLVPSGAAPSLPNEEQIVRRLGMDYHHIPVIWSNPLDEDFEKFEAAMQEIEDKPVLIHSQANFRVTAFYSLYAQKHLGWTAEQAEVFRLQIWRGSDYPVWEAFVRRIRAKIETRQ
jgi:uncharacterized protein (TIGR01244 family)